MLVSAKAKDPALFMTRWAMSYLRGPLTKDQVSTLMKDAPRPAPAPPPAAPEPGVGRRGARGGGRSSAGRCTRNAGRPARRTGRPGRVSRPGCTLGRARSESSPAGRSSGRTWPRASSVRFDDTRAQVDERQEYEALYALDQSLDLDAATVGRLRRP